MGVVHNIGITLVTGRGGALGDLVVDTIVHDVVLGVVHNIGIASTVVKSECCVPASRSKNVTVQIVLC